MLLDEMYPYTLARSLRDKGHDVTAVSTLAELVGRADTIVLDAARAADRCLVTENVRDFAILARYTRHAGILFVSARRWPRTRSGLPRLTLALHDAMTEGRLPGPDELRWLV